MTASIKSEERKSHRDAVVPHDSKEPSGSFSNISDQARTRIGRLFTYLEKALALDDSIIRDFRPTVAAPSPWWLADLPRDVENLYVREFDTETTPEVSEGNSVWLRVEKKATKVHPPLPKELQEWIGEVTPLDSPKAKEKIDRKVRFGDSKERVTTFESFRKQYKKADPVPKILADWVTVAPGKLPDAIEVQYVEDKWTDHPELDSLLVGYVEIEWRPWADKVRKTYEANLLYDQLFALRLLLKNEGDNFELLLGHGLLSWEHAAVGTIYAPIFLVPLVLDFDASKRTIEISPDPMFRSFAEISCLHESNNPAALDLITWCDRINAAPFDFWHFESLRTQARTFLSYVSTASEDCFGEDIVSAPTPQANPSLWNAPVIFARKRSNDLWSKYAGLIRRDIEQSELEATEFLMDLVGEYGEPAQQGQSSSAPSEALGGIPIRESELFFPLFWNDEQKRIAERLDSNYGVVVKGPPGTGKSHTIANLISRFLAQGKSVLVTSQTSKALDVLREKLPENIRSLAVSQLHQSAKRDDILQHSIAEISANLGERQTKFSELRAESIRKELKRVREEKASLANQVRQYILTDSRERIEIDGEEVKPMVAAKLVSQHRDEPSLAWFTDEIQFDTPLSFSEEDLQEAYELLCNLAPEERGLFELALPEHSDLPNEASVYSAFASCRELAARAKTSQKVFGNSQSKLAQQETADFLALLSNAKAVLDSINTGYEQEIFQACITSPHERKKWTSVLSRIAENIRIITTSRTDLLGHEVSGESQLAPSDLREALNALKEKVGSRTKLGTFGRMLLSANAKAVLESFVVDGAAPDSAERINLLCQAIAAQLSEREIRTLLNQGFATLSSPPELQTEQLDMINLEVLVTGLDRLARYHEEFVSLDKWFKANKPLKSLSFAKRTDIETALEAIESHLASFEVVTVEASISEWAITLETSFASKRHRIVNSLLLSIQKRNATGWKSAVAELTALQEKKAKASRLHEIATRIKEHAPNLYRDIEGLAGYGETFQCPKNLGLAWRLSRLESWLDQIHDHVDIDSVQSQLERLTKREQELNSELVTVLAWQRQIDKVSKRQRDALMAWSDAIKKYGKGTGKYANKWLNAAQDALREAKHAVPVWIMPLHRAAQMFSEPKAGMFDVVIFDEASQCDIRGLTIGYLGKKLLVVGDPDQISPAGIFQDLGKGFELISRFLYDMPQKDSFSVTSSLFDLAKIRIPNMIQLTEHFRSVPEIIGFSNHYFYQNLRPLRYPHPKGLLKPALVPVFVKNGYQNRNNAVNEAEATAVVEKLIECLNDPRYEKRPDGRLCTFGIVSLLGQDQAKCIKDLILKHPQIGEKVIEERKIACGDAYAFQGDERDVMFLSMVKALDADDPNDTVKALTDKGAAQRFNVAATRARDQIFLFHSIPLSEFRNPEDWRFRLLNWFYDPRKEELKAGRAALKREFDCGRASPFSFEVGNILIDRGFQVLPEYPVIGYRIDLVIQGEEARLAVECDGDQYHTLETWDEDQVRERQLRRAGWEFWRVTGSAFYRHKEKALESLWKKLTELGIKPIVGS